MSRRPLTWPRQPTMPDPNSQDDPPQTHVLPSECHHYCVVEDCSVYYTSPGKYLRFTMTETQTQVLVEAQTQAAS
jgi:hypothetical protein